MIFRDLPSHWEDASYRYDHHGRLVETIDRNPHWCAFGYDALVQLSWEASSVGGTVGRQHYPAAAPG